MRRKEIKGLDQNFVPPLNAPINAEAVETMFGENAIKALNVGFLRAQQITSGILRSVDGRTFFSLDDSKIQLSDLTHARWIADGKNTKFVISKPGIDANLATAANSFLYIDNSGTKAYFSKTFSSVPIQRVLASSAPGVSSELVYDTAAFYRNSVVILDFYKSSSWTFVSGSLQLKFQSGAFDSGANFVPNYQTSNRVFLNATETTVQSYPFGVWIRYSGGTQLTLDGQSAPFNLSVSNLIFTDTFDSTEIGAMVDGWNRIVVQTDNNQFDAYSFGEMNLNLIGYETIL